MTSTFDVEEARTHLTALDLGREAAPEVAAAAGVTPMTLADGKTLVVFDSKLSHQDREDLENSLLLAQQAADKKYSQLKQLQDWFDELVRDAKIVGWRSSGGRTQEYKSSERSFKLSEVALDLLKSLTGTSAIGAAAQAIDKIHKMDKEGRPVANIFSKAGKTVKEADFTIGYGQPGPEGPEIAIVAFSVYFEREVRDYLVVETQSQETAVKVSTAKFILNTSLYPQIRADVLRKLGKRANDLIARLDA